VVGQRFAQGFGACAWSCCRQRLHAHHGTRAHGMGKTLDCSHGWRAPAAFDACHHALGRAHACGYIALRQTRFRACGNQFTGQLKLGRLRVIGLANGGVGQGHASSADQVQFHPIRSPSCNPCAKKVRVFRPYRTAYRHCASQNGPIIRITHRNSLECLRFEALINAKLQRPYKGFQGIQNDHR